MPSGRRRWVASSNILFLNVRHSGCTNNPVIPARKPSMQIQCCQQRQSSGARAPGSSSNQIPEDSGWQPIGISADSALMHADIAQLFACLRFCWCMRCTEPAAVAWITTGVLEPPTATLHELATRASIPTYIISPINDTIATVQTIWPSPRICTLTIRQFFQIISSQRMCSACRAHVSSGSIADVVPVHSTLHSF
jgi:hypothetical protein